MEVGDRKLRAREVCSVGLVDGVFGKEREKGRPDLLDAFGKVTLNHALLISRFS